MDQQSSNEAPSSRDYWLAVLDKNGVGHPKVLNAVDVPGGCVHATLAEPPGRLSVDASQASVLMCNMSPVQGLKQTREGRSFVSDMLRGDLTLMPHGVPSQWSWNSVCDRLDMMVHPDVFGDGSKLEVVDRYLFRDSELEGICRDLHQKLSFDGLPERLYVETQLMKAARCLLLRHSTASQAARILPRGGLARSQARRVLDYIESNLSQGLTLKELAEISELSLHHFARMFKRTMGVPPHRYILERRLERAKEMLRTSRASLADISLSVGFDSQSHFTTAFGRMVGATPTEFQTSSRGRR